MSTRGQRRRRRRRILVALGAAVVIIGVVVVSVFAWYQGQLGAGDGPHTPKIVEVPSGSTNADIADLLADAGVVSNARAFGWHVRLSGAGPFEAGRYRFELNSSADDAIDVLTRGPLGPQITRISIPEGFRLAQMINRIHEKVPRFTEKRLHAVLDDARVSTPLLPEGTTNYEGLLFPATYDVTPKTTPVALLQEMADTMTARVDGLTIDADVQAMGLSDYQLVIVASLVQAEAGNPDEAPKVARVIYNRLAAGQPLGIDATSRYLSIITGDEVDFASDSPYNTRRNPGLPPTPIGAPGDFALDAAAHPAKGDWHYYVLATDKDAQGRPQHVFTDSYDEFLRAKQACHDAGLGCGGQ